MVVVFRNDLKVQGRFDEQRELLDAESVAGHLLKPGSVFGFLAAHRHELFAETAGNTQGSAHTDCKSALPVGSDR